MDTLMSRAAPPKIPSVAEILGETYKTRADLREAFPDVEPGLMPFGYLLVVQLRTPRKRIGSLYVPDDTRDGEKYRTQVGLVRAMGPSCFKRRDTGDPWVEGNWCEVGAFVRAPMWGGDRWAVKFGKGDDEALFIAVKDTDLIGLQLGDPLAVLTS